jgi:hypothetical protein
MIPLHAQTTANGCLQVTPPITSSPQSPADLRRRSCAVISLPAACPSSSPRQPPPPLISTLPPAHTRACSYTRFASVAAGGRRSRFFRPRRRHSRARGAENVRCSTNASCSIRAIQLRSRCHAIAAMSLCRPHYPGHFAPWSAPPVTFSSFMAGFPIAAAPTRLLPPSPPPSSLYLCLRLHSHRTFIASIV